MSDMPRAASTSLSQGNAINSPTVPGMRAVPASARLPGVRRNELERRIFCNVIVDVR